MPESSTSGVSGIRGSLRKGSFLFAPRPVCWAGQERPKDVRRARQKGALTKGLQSSLSNCWFFCLTMVADAVGIPKQSAAPTYWGRTNASVNENGRALQTTSRSEEHPSELQSSENL